MEQARYKSTSRYRKNPRKTGVPLMDNRSLSAQAHHFNQNFMQMPINHDYNQFGQFFSMMNLNDMNSQQQYSNFYRQPQQQFYPPQQHHGYPPMADISNFQNYQPRMFAPVPRSRTSSFLPSDTSNSEVSSKNTQIRPYSSAAIERPQRRMELMAKTNLVTRSTSSMSSKLDTSKITSSPILPNWAIDAHAVLKKNVTLKKVLDSGDLMKFAMDKAGCQFLQDSLKKELHGMEKSMIFDQLLERKDTFMKLSTNMFGNFFVQQVIELSANWKDPNFESRQEKIKEIIASRLTELCLDKSACRVVQFALEYLDIPKACYLVQRLPRDARLISICIDQNANHVIQKVVGVIPLNKWEFIVDFIAQAPHMRQICSDKYGCRVVQTIIEKLTNDSINTDLTLAARNHRERALQRLMNAIVSRCADLATNEYANYIIQHILSCENMAVYRETIIEKCLMRNLLSLSQEKFASHVVEKAFLHAPLGLLGEMMYEIFEGYVPHPVTGKDALDIMMFHQYGNYVVQCMLTICCEAVAKKRPTQEGCYDHLDTFQEWFRVLQTRVTTEKTRLSRFSSGKKMIETLQAAREELAPTSSIAQRKTLSMVREKKSCDTFSTASEEDFYTSDTEQSVLLEHRRHKRISESTNHDGDDEVEDRSSRTSSSNC